ncbi:MAG: outer membrane beta-barrel protein [Chitinophagaceae bacterium]
MKKVIFLAFATTAIIHSHAQTGITAGMNLSRYSIKADAADLTDRKAIMSWNAGIYYRKPLSKIAALQPELAWTGKGGQAYPFYPIGYTGPMKYVNRLGYLQLTVPVMLDLSLPSMDDNDNFRIDIGAGPYAAALLKATATAVEFDDSKATSDYTIGKDASNGFKRMDYGMRYIAGFTMLQSLGAHLQYDQGFRNIEPNPAYRAIRARNFSVNLSWQFGDKKD